MSPIILSSQFQKENLHSECSLCLSTILTGSNFQCLSGHFMCKHCLGIFKQCAVCQEDHHLGDQIVSQKICKKTPLRFHRVHGTLVHISNDAVRATVTGSDLSPSLSLAYTFFDRPVQANEKVQINVSLGEQKSGFLTAGFTNQDPASGKNLPKLLNESCCFKIRPKINKSVVSFSVAENGKMCAEIGGKEIRTEQPTKSSKSVDPSKPIWAFVRLFHKNDQIVIIS